MRVSIASGSSVARGTFKEISRSGTPNSDAAAAMRDDHTSSVALTSALRALLPALESRQGAASGYGANARATRHPTAASNSSYAAAAAAKRAARAFRCRRWGPRPSRGPADVEPDEGTR